MHRTAVRFALALLLTVLAVPALQAQVVINEVAWMGTTTSTSDEWIELHNTSAASVDATGWTLESTDGTP